MLVEHVPTAVFYALFLAYALVIASCIFAGLVAPQVWMRETVSSWQCEEGARAFNASCLGSDLAAGETWAASIGSFTKMNQNLRLIASLQNLREKHEGVEKTIPFTISMSARAANATSAVAVIDHVTHDRQVVCYEGETYCEDLVLIYEPYMSYNVYSITVDMELEHEEDQFVGDVLFTFQYVNQDYTILELWFRFGCLMVAFCSLLLLTFALRHRSWSEWTTEQKWTAVLLFGVMAYDNPFLPMTILLKGWFFPLLDQLFSVTFFALLFFFFLYTLDTIRLRADGSNRLLYHVPKVVLLVLIWIVCVVVWAWVEFHDISDPEYATVYDVPYYRAFFYTLLALLGIYAFYLAYIALRSLSAMRKQRGNGSWGRRILFFLGFTALAIFIALLGLVLNLAGPTRTHASIFLIYFAIFNLYTAVLAFLYMPFGHVDDIVKEKLVDHEEELGKVGDEDFQESPYDVAMEEVAVAEEDPQP